MNDIRKRIAETVLRDNAVSGSGLTAEDIAGFIETPADRARGDLALPGFPKRCARARMRSHRRCARFSAAMPNLNVSKPSADISISSTAPASI